MKRILSRILLLLVTLTAAANGLAQYSIAKDQFGDLLAPFNVKTGQTIQFKVGSTLDVDGTFHGTPTGGTLNLSAVTLTLPTATVNLFQPVDGDLTALSGLTSIGLLARTAADTYALRTIAVPAAGISITNANGVAGNPTLALANDLAALEGLSGTGLAARTGTDAWAQRTITGTEGQVIVTNGDGIAGNPTISLPSTITQAMTFSGVATFSNTTASTTKDNGAAVIDGGLGVENDVQSGGLFKSTRATETDGVFNAVVTGDSVNRFTVDARGRMEWGSGTSARDVNLYRSAADTLRTDDTLLVGAGRVQIGTAGTSDTDSYLTLAPFTSGGSIFHISNQGTGTFTISRGAIGSETATTDLTISSGHVRPGVDATGDLGSATLRWRDVYLSRSLNIGGVTSDTNYFINSSGGQMLLGGDQNSDTSRTNGVVKRGRWGTPHYNNTTEEPVLGMWVENGLSSNTISYGGGSSVWNAATSHTWYTAANNATVTGTAAANLDNTRLAINHTTASASKDSGAIVTEGGLGVELDIRNGGAVVSNSRHNAGATATNAVEMDGGSSYAYVKGYATSGGAKAPLSVEGSTVTIRTGSGTGSVAGTFDTTRLDLPFTTPSTSTTTGAFTVAGGAGFGGAIYSGGAVTAAGINLNQTFITRAIRDALYFDGATAGSRVYMPLPAGTGASDWTRLTVFKMPDSTVTSSRQLWAIGGTNDANVPTNGGPWCYFETDGSVRINMYDNGGNVRRKILAGFQTTYAGQWVVLEAGRSFTSSTMTIRWNGIDVTPADNVTGAINWNYSHPDSFAVLSAAGASLRWQGPVALDLLGNGLLTAAESLAFVQTGRLPPSWEAGTGSPVLIVGPSTLNGGFETAGAGGADVFANWGETTAGTSSVNRDTTVFSAGAAACRFDVDGSGSVAHVAMAGVLKSGWRYRLRCKTRTNKPAGISAFQYSGGGVGNDTVASITPIAADTWGDVDLTFESTGTEFRITRSSSAALAGFSQWVDEVRLEALGPIYKPIIQPGVAVRDSGTNNLTGVITSGVTPITDGTAGSFTSTLAWSGTHEAKSLLGTQAIPANAIVTRIVTKATAASSGSGLTISSTNTAGRWVATNTFTTAKKIHTLANQLPAGTAANDLDFVVDPDTANYTGSITVTVFYEVTDGNP